MVIIDPAKATVPIPDDYLIAIGKVCVQWGNLEIVMELCITKLAGMDVDQRSKIMINHMAWPMRMDVFMALAHHLVDDNPRLKGYQTVASHLKKAQEGRNRVIHSHWGSDGGTVMALQASARGKLKFSVGRITVKEINAVLLDINVAMAALYNLVIGNP